MSLYSLQDLVCCICGTPYRATVNTAWHGFDKAVCGQKCFYEKQWRRTLSMLGKDYYLDPREYDAHGYPTDKRTGKVQ